LSDLYHQSKEAATEVSWFWFSKKTSKQENKLHICQLEVVAATYQNEKQSFFYRIS